MLHCIQSTKYKLLYIHICTACQMTNVHFVWLVVFPWIHLESFACVVMLTASKERMCHLCDIFAMGEWNATHVNRFRSEQWTRQRRVSSVKQTTRTYTKSLESPSIALALWFIFWMIFFYFYWVQCLFVLAIYYVSWCACGFCFGYWKAG